MPTDEAEFTDYYENILEHDAGIRRDLGDGEADGPKRVVAADRLFAIDNLVLGGSRRYTYAAEKRCGVHRRRSRTLWSDVKGGAPAGFSPDDSDEERANGATLRRAASLMYYTT